METGGSITFRTGSVMCFLLQCCDNLVKTFDIGGADAPNHCSFQVGQMVTNSPR